MQDYKPPYEITDMILNLVSSITEKTDQIVLTDKQLLHPKLHRRNRIRSIHSSLRIEANSLALTDVQDIIDGHKVAGPEKDILEVKNAYSAYEILNKVNPYSEKDLLKVHGLMTKNTLMDSGKYRTTGEGVFSGDKCIFLAPPAEMVPVLIRQLLNWSISSKDSVHPLILSSVFHYEFVFIHPFTDGNGRMARLWHTILLSKWKPLFEYLPIESQIENNQADYYKAINESNECGKATKFIEFSLLMIDKALSEMIVQCQSHNANCSEYVNKLIDCMELNIPYTTVKLLTLLNLKSRENLRKYYIGPAMKQGIVVMEIPDKPSSRNQRYIKIK